MLPNPVSRSHLALRMVQFLIVQLVLLFTIFSSAHAVIGAGSEWTTPLGTAQGTRFSNLTQINQDNASDLVEERVILTGTKGGHEGQPLVVNVQGKMRMYVVTPWPNKLIALDMTGKTLWTYKPRTNEFAKGVACCDAVNRGAVYGSGRVIYSRLDGTVVAVNALTGKAIWQTKIANYKVGETLTGAPIIAGTKVIVGNAGGEMGVRGWVAGLDLTSGKLVWKAYNTGPDSDVKIDASKNFYPSDQGKDLGSTTWGAGSMGGSNLWKQGGSTVWAWFTYDPDQNLVFYGTANPGVWNPDMRLGDNKWSASIFARDPNTGKAKWAKQLTPHDGWDYDAMNESIVIPYNVPSGAGKALVHFNKNGFAYLLDAGTGQVLKADAYVNTTWASSIDLQTGIPNLIPKAIAHEGMTTLNICPSPLGGKEFSPAAYSPNTNLFYVPAINFCSSLQPLKALYIAGSPFMGADVGFSPDMTSPTTFKPFGELVAWDVKTGSKAWSVDEAAPLFGGVLATAGNVIFYGTLDRKFKAVDATTGAVLLTKNLECGVMSNPITYVGDDGKQRVAVYSGIGWLPAGFAGGTCPSGGQDGEDEDESGSANNANNKGYGSGAVHIYRLP